jgi:hypothetical protein
MNERKVVGGIFFDLQKEFDSVNHTILTKLEFYGVAGTILKLIKFYLEHRHQKVILDNISPIPILTTWSIAFLALHKRFAKNC